MERKSLGSKCNWVECNVMGRYGAGGRCRRGLEEENSRDQLQEEKEIILEIKTFLKKVLLWVAIRHGQSGLKRLAGMVSIRMYKRRKG